MKIFIGCILTVVTSAWAHREHKVHNIVLYPDKQSWCKTTPIKQVVAEVGYEAATIDNSVCVGACFSYSIPHTEPADPGELIVPYCDSCQPLHAEWYHVTLHASREENPDLILEKSLPSTIQKRIQIITNCTCMSCDQVVANTVNTQKTTSELPSDLFSYRHQNGEDEITPNEMVTQKEEQSPTSYEVPDLFQLVNRTKNETNHFRNFDISNVTDEQKFYLNSKLINLLKSIQNSSDDTATNFNYDKALLHELLQIIEGSEHKLNDKNLMEFVNFVNVHNSEDFELDLSRLKQVLMKFQHGEHEKQKHYGTTTYSEKEQNGHYDVEVGKSEDMDETMTRHRHFGLGIEGSHLGMGHLKGAHVGMGITPIKLNENDEEINTPNRIHIPIGEFDHNSITNEDSMPEKHHHVGEKQNLGLGQHGTGHLIHGPHGSLVLQPDESAPGVEEKLNMEPHLLKPNHAGTILSYESHVEDKNKILRRDLV